MSRAVWKGPFVEASLLKKVEKQKNNGDNKRPIKIAIPPMFGVNPSWEFLPPPLVSILFFIASLITEGITRKVPKKLISDAITIKFI